MKTKTDNYLFFSKIFLGMFIAAISISILILIIVLVWGYFDPNILSKFTWKPDLIKIRNSSNFYYVLVGLITFLPMALYFLLFYSLIKILSKLDFENPFNNSIAKSMEQISFYLLGIFFINFLGESLVTGILDRIEFEKTNHYIQHFNYDLGRFYPLVAASITYIFSLIYKKGLEIQEENNLTV